MLVGAMVAMLHFDTLLHIVKNWIFRVECNSVMIPIIIPLTIIINLKFN